MMPNLADNSPVHPLVSVITPAFNAAATLERACLSLRDQDIRDWEHIIVNDGSTDNTLNVAQAIAASDPRVKIISTDNRGNGAAHNAGLKQLSGAFVTFLDADDEYLPGHLRKRLTFFNENPSVDIIWGGLEVVADNEADAYVPDIIKGEGVIHASECMVHGTIAVRRKVVDRFQFTEDPEIWYRDYEFLMKASKVFRMERFTEVTYRYYRNTGRSIVDRAKAALKL